MEYLTWKHYVRHNSEINRRIKRRKDEDRET